MTANEGDSREYAGLREEVRVRSARLDAGAFPNATALQAPSNLGR